MATKAIFTNCFKRMADDGKLSPEEVQRLEQVYTEQFFTARRGRMSLPEAVQAAKKAAGERVKTDKGLQQFRAAKQILAIAETYGYANAHRGAHKSVMDSANRKLMFHADGKDATTSVDVVADGVYRDAGRAIVQMVESIGTKALGLSDNAQRLRFFVEAMFGNKTGDKAIDDAAAALSKMFEDLRLRANRAGADIGRVAERYLPQSHDALRIAEVPRGEWVEAVLPKLDRSRYVNEDGSLLTDAQMREMLNDVYMTLATDGASKPAGPSGGRGGVANRNSKERELHFKDAASWLDYNARFGARGLIQMVDQSVRGLSDQIALLETMGPNPQETLNAIYNLEVQRLKDAGKTGEIEQLGKDKELTDFLLGELTGANRKAKKGGAARVWRDLRALQALKLGAAYITSWTDHITTHMTAALWKMSHGDLLVENLRGLNVADKAHRTQVVNAGLMADGAIARMEEFGAEMSRSTAAEKLSNLQMKMSLLNWATRMRRENFSAVLSNTLGSMADRLGLSELPEIAKVYGITEQDWGLWKAAKKENWGRGETMLTADSVYGMDDAQVSKAVGKELTVEQARSAREQAVTRLLGVISNESKMAVLEPSRLTRAKINKFAGDSEIMRAMLQFKSFPIALISQHIVRGINLRGSARVYYLTALATGMTLMGAVTGTVADLLAGKNPRPLLDPSDKHFAASWAAAALKGGALGIFGDFLFAQQSRMGSSVGAILTGPALGDLITLGDIALQARSDVAHGKAPDIGSKFMNVAKSYVPFSSLWYTRGLFNHAFVQNAQEAMNPGYLRRMTARAKRDYGQSFYWQPGQALPNQAPDFEELTGQ